MMPTKPNKMGKEVQKRPLKQREYVKVVGVKGAKKHIIEGKEYTFEKKIAESLVKKGWVKPVTAKEAK